MSAAGPAGPALRSGWCVEVCAQRRQVLLCLLQDIIFSFPVKCSGGKWEIVQGLKIDEFSAEKIKATGDDAAFAFIQTAAAARPRKARKHCCDVSAAHTLATLVHCLMRPVQRRNFLPAGGLPCSSGSSSAKAVCAAGEELVEEKKLALQCLSEQEN